MIVGITGKAGADGGTKFDDGKPMVGLIPPMALLEVAKVYTFGAKKYAAHNWRKGLMFSRNYDALQRHAMQFWNGENIDSDSRCHHLAAVCFNALCMLQFLLDGRTDLDDRYRRDITAENNVEEKTNADTE